MKMKSKRSLALSREHSQQKKPDTLLVSVMLTKSEVAQLQREKKEISDFALKEFESIIRPKRS